MEKMTPLNQIIYVARDRSRDFVRDSQARTLILSSMHFGKWNLIRASESLSLSSRIEFESELPMILFYSLILSRIRLYQLYSK